jgi:hypothetical protein
MDAFEYAAKFVCGKTTGAEVAPGSYFTAINVHNPATRAITFRKKIAIAGPRETPGPVTELFDVRLGPDEALEIDCPDIREHARVDAEFLKGFVVLQSDVELDVVGVYSAAPVEGEITALHMERVPPRRSNGGLPDLVPVSDPEGNYCRRDEQGNLVVTVHNQGSGDAGASTTTVAFARGGTFSQPTPAITAGSSVDLAFSIPPTCFDPDCEFRIIVDSNNDVAESNEGNNFAVGRCRG